MSQPAPWPTAGEYGWFGRPVELIVDGYRIDGVVSEIRYGEQIGDDPPSISLVLSRLR